MDSVIQPTVDQISFRQKGSEIKGSLIRGTVHNAYQKTNLGTIPAKYESILKPILYEKKVNIEKEVINEDDKISHSSKNRKYKEHDPNLFLGAHQRGTQEKITGFSKFDQRHLSTSNLRGRENENNEQINNLLNLNEDEMNATQKTVQNFNVVQRFKYKINEMPGPGAYNPKILKPTNKKISSCFRSNSYRFKLPKPEITPSPAYYNIDIDVEKRLMPSGNSSNFRIPELSVDPRGTMGPTNLSERIKARLPGPGQYSEDHNSIIKMFQKNYKLYAKSSVFNEPLILDKFGKPKFRIKNFTAIPGPGTYEKQSINFPDTLSPEFKKGPERHNFYKYGGIKPGPAFYYIPRSINKESRNSNHLGLWF